MPFSFLRVAALLALPLLAAACATKAPVESPAATIAGYEGVQDGEFFVPPVPARYLWEEQRRQEVAYNGTEAPGTIVVDVYSRKLYYVLEGGRAMRYAIAVGREGTSFRGKGYIGRKAEWPRWTPTANMVRTQPEMYSQFAGGLEGGLENPLGSRALYLYRGGRDTMFRIHGTIDPRSIGRATSAGCIRLFNQDVMDLFERVENGATVVVRTLEESIALDGPHMDDAWGRIVAVTPENEARKAKEAEMIERERAKFEADMAKAEEERLKRCEAAGIRAALCPPSEQTEDFVIEG